MAVKVTSQVRENDGKLRVELFSDAVETLPTTGVGIDNLKDSEELATGSSCLSADGSMAFLKSNGTWNWV